MKTKHSLWKKKLVHTSMLVSALLIAATMITSAAIPVGTLPMQSSMPLNPIVNEKQSNAVSLAAPSDSRVLSPMRTEGTLNTQQSTPSPLDRNLLWNNSFPDGVNGLSFGIWTGYNRELIDDFQLTGPSMLQGGSFRMLIYSGAGSANVANIDVRIFADVGGVPQTTELFTFMNCAFTAVNTGNTYFTRPEIKVTVTIPSTYLSPGTYWIEFMPTCNPAENCFWLTSPGWGGEIKLCFPDYSYPRWTAGSVVFGTVYLGVSFELTGIPAGVQHDVGVSSIISPVAGSVQPFIPKVTVMNNGNQTEYAVPVEMNIDRYIPATAPVYYMFEEFPGTTFPPTGWTTLGGTLSGWRRSTGNQAGGTAPQAYCYYTYADPMDYMRSLTVNTANVTNHLYLSYRSMYDYYSAGTYAWVQTRRNATDTWTDRQPWANPISADIPAALYTVDITDDIGPQTQVQFIRDGPYANFRYWYVDNVYIYSQTPGYYTDEYYAIQNVDIPQGGRLDVTFPTWTPYGYQTQENQDIQYKAVATTYLVGDEIPADDSQTKVFIIHYPYLHDVGVDSIISPVTDGLAQTQVVKAVIKNYGQFTENWFETQIQIGAELHTPTSVCTDFEADTGGFTQVGTFSLWQWGVPTSGPGAAYSGTKLWGTNLAGNYQNSCNERLYSPVINNLPANCKLSFWHWYSTENYYDGGNIKISVNGGAYTLLGVYLNPYNEDAFSTGNAANPGQPGFSGSSSGWKYVIMNLDSYVSQNIQLMFQFGSDSSVNTYPGWYVDDVCVYAVSVDPEYYDSDWQGQTGLAPLATREITFDPFVPDGIAAGISGDITYVVSACTLLGGDTHTANDCKTEDFTLTYVHDVTVKKINEPSSAKGTLGDVIFSQRPYTPDESWSFYTSAVGASYVCQDDFSGLADPITDVEWSGIPLIYSGGWTQGSPTGMTFEIKFYGPGSAPGAVTDTFTNLAPTFEAGDIYGGAYQSYNWAVDLEYGVIAESGWISIQSIAAPDGSWFLWSGSPEGTLNALQNGAALSDNLAFSLTSGGGGGGHPPVTVYVKKGTTNPIQITVNDVGTFDETVTANVALYEYVTEPVNGTELYTDSHSGIALTPLGGESVQDFTGQLYALEGVYALYANTMPAGVDDVPDNNAKGIGIGSDGTPPVTTYTLTPATPDGTNGWYVSDVTIKLAATDPTVAEVSSGVATIEYQVDGGAWQTYTGTAGFKLTTDSGNHIVKYRATDKVGNVETDKTIPVIKIDKTKPIIEMSYNTTGGNAIQGWELTFYVTATDATSGMAYVEFYFNGELEKTEMGAGPEYTFVWNYSYLPSIIIKAIAYDVAGNNIFETIENPTNLDLPLQQSHTIANIR